MSLRYFEGEDIAKAYVKFRPVPPPKLIQRLISFIREKYPGPLDSAVDLGCGNGQCAFTLGGAFSTVLGTDISPAQVAEARELCSQLKCRNVAFVHAPAERIPTPDDSVQLITICEAAHWMDLPKVYEEGRRVLAKNGVFAILGYLFPIYVPLNDKEKADGVNQLMQKSLENLQDFWPPEIRSCHQEYPDVEIPFSDFTRERGFKYQRPCKIADIIGCFRSYSIYQNIIKGRGEAAGYELLYGIADGIIKILNEDREKPMTPEEIQNYEFMATWDYFVLMARI